MLSAWASLDGAGRYTNLSTFTFTFIGFQRVTVDSAHLQHCATLHYINVLNNNNNNNNNWQFKAPARWLRWPPLTRKPSQVCCVADSSHFPADRSGNTGSHQWVCARISGRLGLRISVLSGDDREHLFLFQRISVAIQRFNAVLLHDGFHSEDHPD